MTTRKSTYQIIQLIALAISGIAALTICGYISGNPKLYAWFLDNPMALNTSVCFLLTGVSIFMLARRVFYTIK